MDRPLKLIIEALLFVSEKPLSIREIKALVDNEPSSNIRQAIKELQDEYDRVERSFALKEVAQGFQLRTRSAYSPYVLRMLKTTSTRLSKAALETLAIIAYKQPVLRQQIERLRGVDAGGILRTLLEKNLIRIVGRKNIPGRPLIYGTTKRFLEVFDLVDLDSLPKLKEIKDLGAEVEGTEPPWANQGQQQAPNQEEALTAQDQVLDEPGAGPYAPSETP